MQGNNTQSKEGFIKGQTHPRKKELAEIMLSAEGAETSAQAGLDAGYDRITVLEMGRQIRRNVEGYESFVLNIERGNGDVRKLKVTSEEDEEKAPEAPVDAPTAPEAPVEDQTIVGSTPATQATTDAPETTPEAPVAPETVPATPTAPQAPVDAPVAPTA